MRCLPRAVTLRALSLNARMGDVCWCKSAESFEQPGTLAYQGLREGMPYDIGIMQKFPKARTPPEAMPPQSKTKV